MGKNVGEDSEWKVAFTSVKLSNRACYDVGGQVIIDWLKSDLALGLYAIRSAVGGGFEFEFDNPDTAFAFKMKFA